MLKWYNIYDAVTKELVSSSSHDPDTDDGIKSGVDLAGLAAKGLIAEENLSGEPDLGKVMWDKNITAFVNRPPDPDALIRTALRAKERDEWTPGDITNAKRLL